MYGLPQDFDFSIFSGRVLEQVCFREYQIALLFDQDVSVTVEGTFAHLAPDGTRQPGTTEFPVVASSAMALVGRRISVAKGTGDGTLSLLFDNGEQFVCYDTPGYESYHVVVRGKTTIV